MSDSQAELVQPLFEPGSCRERRRRRTQPGNERAHLDFATLQLILHVFEALQRAFTISVEQTASREELKRAARDRLHQTVVELARQPHALVKGGGIAHVLDEVKTVESRDDESGDENAE